MQKWNKKSVCAVFVGKNLCELSSGIVDSWRIIVVVFQLFLRDDNFYRYPSWCLEARLFSTSRLLSELLLCVLTFVQDVPDIIFWGSDIFAVVCVFFARKIKLSSAIMKFYQNPKKSICLVHSGKKIKRTYMSAHISGAGLNVRLIYVHKKTCVFQIVNCFIVVGMHKKKSRSAP